MNSVPFQCALCDLGVVGVGPVQYVTAGYRGNTMTDLNIDDCINETCPWSGKPVQADSLALYGDDVVGLCNPGCRDKFESAVRHFEEAREVFRVRNSRLWK